MKRTFLALLGLLFVKAQMFDFNNQKKAIHPSCNKDLPNLSVGDILLTQDNYFEFKKNNKLFVLALSDSECDACCALEEYLKNVTEIFKSGEYKYKVRLFSS